MDYDDKLEPEGEIDIDKLAELDDGLADDASVFDDMDDGGFAHAEEEEEELI